MSTLNVRAGSRPGFSNTLAVYLNLTIEALGSRFRGAHFGWLIAIGEPVVIIVASTLAHVLTGQATPPCGDSLLLFYATGVLPYYLFFHTSWKLRAWDIIPRLPNVGETTLFLAQVSAELVVKATIVLIVCAAMWLDGSTSAIPYNILTCLFALLIASALGGFAGLINASIAAFFTEWVFIYAIAVRISMAIVGALTVVDQLPVAIRTIASWIPLTHVILLYRIGQYQTFRTGVLDMFYLYCCVVGVAVLGPLLEKSTRSLRSFQ